MSKRDLLKKTIAALVTSAVLTQAAFGAAAKAITLPAPEKSDATFQHDVSKLAKLTGDKYIFLEWDDVHKEMQKEGGNKTAVDERSAIYNVLKKSYPAEDEKTLNRVADHIKKIGNHAFSDPVEGKIRLVVQSSTENGRSELHRNPEMLAMKGIYLGFHALSAKFLTKLTERHELGHSGQSYGVNGSEEFFVKIPAKLPHETDKDREQQRDALYEGAADSLAVLKTLEDAKSPQEKQEAYADLEKMAAYRNAIVTFRAALAVKKDPSNIPRLLCYNTATTMQETIKFEKKVDAARQSGDWSEVKGQIKILQDKYDAVTGHAKIPFVGKDILEKIQKNTMDTEDYFTLTGALSLKYTKHSHAEKAQFEKAAHGDISALKGDVLLAWFWSAKHVRFLKDKTDPIFIPAQQAVKKVAATAGVSEEEALKLSVAQVEKLIKEDDAKTFQAQWPQKAKNVQFLMRTTYKSVGPRGM